jgi:hypothetical protein
MNSTFDKNGQVCSICLGEHDVCLNAQGICERCEKLDLQMRLASKTQEIEQAGLCQWELRKPLRKHGGGRRKFPP